ncbi:MAG TPA: hypothetical protein VJ948_05320 [Acidimicrobiia bacterium]|nr:hypothetical protein [Acidimicrobiia bacterium]
MSHLRPEDRKSRHSRSACKRGRHHYGEAQSIGGGIRRQVCETCGGVTIDLSGAEPPADVIRRSDTIGSVPGDS